MALRLGSKQILGPINIGTSSTLVGAIANCSGARYILVRAYAGPNGNSLSSVLNFGSTDGVNLLSGISILGSGSGPTNTTLGMNLILTYDIGAPGAHPIPWPFVILFATIVTAGGNVTFDCWPAFDENEPSLILGRKLP